MEPPRSELVAANGEEGLMYFDSLSAVWHMDGHGFYVWLSYALTFLPVAIMLWLPIRRQRQLWQWIVAEQRRVDLRHVDAQSK